ncbi:DeoR family transcriptional regulator [bacterium]|nr:DeoR family transcriptional regulator [bacterium]
MRKIILLIKDESQSKEELVQKIWGYQYDPLRHDPLIYSSMNKVRRLLSPHGDWIQLTENGYQIQKNIKVIIKNTLKQKSIHQKVVEAPVLQSATNKIKVSPKWHKHAKDLNFRQLQVLDYLKNQNSISVLELSNKLLISKPTATRDLSKLHKLGILSRVGHGRATRYFL